MERKEESLNITNINLDLIRHEKYFPALHEF